MNLFSVFWKKIIKWTCRLVKLEVVSVKAATQRELDGPKAEAVFVSGSDHTHLVVLRCTLPHSELVGCL